MSALLGREAFIDELRVLGDAHYHDKHPFHRRMHAGQLSMTELRRWVLNRYYYQTRIPIKDALILAKTDDVAFRRRWIRRILDHDGRSEDYVGGPDDGGLVQWQRLAQAVGCDLGEVISLRSVLPGVRFACDAYVALVRERSLLEAVASSLTEFFAPDLMTRRIDAWLAHYPQVGPEALEYFRTRVGRARHDSTEAVDFVANRAETRQQQLQCGEALLRKCEILWAMLDAIEAGGQAPSNG